MVLAPSTTEELSALIRAHSRLLPVGAQTKPRLSAATPEAVLVSTRNLSGITEYEPSEFTITAHAGTPLREITAALQCEGQYFPWDPPLVETGATLGGTIAAGLSGAGRFRFGGLRDFLLAVQFADGIGRLLRMGAKVVKNAAGFDVPKFLVGSLGRYGVITEATFKVFPSPAHRLTLSIPCASSVEARDRLALAASARWEIEALNYEFRPHRIVARLGGPPEANAALHSEMIARWPEATVWSEDAAAAYWAADREFHWAGPILAKLPLTLGHLIPLLEALSPIPGADARLMAAGNLTWLSFLSPEAAQAGSRALAQLGLSALVLRGNTPLYLGNPPAHPLADRLLPIFDPSGRFRRATAEG